VSGPAVTDELLEASKFVGVVRFRRNTSGESDFVVRGASLAWWLGTENKLGDVIETPKTFSSAPFNSTITSLLPAAIRPGTLVNTALPPYTGSHQWQTRREAIDYVCDTVGAEWRIRSNGKLDAGKYESLWPAEPRALILRSEHDAGDTMAVRAFAGRGSTDRDIAEFTTRAVVLGKVEQAQVVQGSANIDPALNPYRDLFGNPVVMTRLVSETSTEAVNADVRAQIQVDENSRPSDVITVDTGTYDLRGTIEVGDYVWVWDPAAGLEDHGNEILFRGQRIHPVREMVREIDWPVEAAMGVYYRARDGSWLDLSDWVDPVEGQTNIEIGKKLRDIQDLPGGSTVVGRDPAEADSSIPTAPHLVGPFEAVAYAIDSGVPKAQVKPKWTHDGKNTNGTEFLDGANWEVRYRPAPARAITWADLASKKWNELGTWGDPLTPTTVNPGEWVVHYAPIDQYELLIPELQVAARYEFQVRVLDSANPPNHSAWSNSVHQYMPKDDQPPATPAAPMVAGSQARILVESRLGADTGGDFNLALDLAYLDVHAQVGDPNFVPDASTRLGKIEATRAQILGQIPVIASFAVSSTAELHVKLVAVDTSGNPSAPSASSPVTAELIEAAWIGTVHAESVISGTVRASLIVGGEIATGPSGQRVTITQDGIRAFLADGKTRFFDLDVLNQRATLVGEYSTAFSGSRIRINPGGNSPNRIDFYALNNSAEFASIEGQLGPENQPAVSVFANNTTGSARGGVMIVRRNFASLLYGTKNASYVGSDIFINKYNARVSAGVVDIGVDTRSEMLDGLPKRVAFQFWDENRMPIAQTALWYQRTAYNEPWLQAPRFNSGFVFAPSRVYVKNNLNNGDVEISALSFIQTSDERAKERISDARALLDPDQVIRRARARLWKFRHKRSFTPPPTKDDPNPERVELDDPWHFGPLAGDLPPEVKREGPGGLELVDQSSMLGLLWGWAGQVQDQQAVATTALASLPAGTVLAAGESVQVPVLWTSRPPAVPNGGAAFVANLDLLGRLTAWVETSSATHDGATVVIKNYSDEPLQLDVPAYVQVLGTGLFIPPYVPEEAVA
jgi:hypothetical protein